MERLGQLAVFIALLVLPVAGYCGEEKAVRLAPGWQSVGIAKLAGYSAPRILNSDGSVWMGRGANLHDTRSCDACAYEPLSASNIAEVERRADKLIDIWGANYIHLSMDSYSAQFANKDPNSPRRQYKNVVGDPDYLRAIEQIVKHITDKGAYVLLYLHSDPCLGANPAAARGDEVRIGAPTARCIPVWRKLAGVFRENPKVQYGLAAEPTSPSDNRTTNDGSADQVWAKYNAVIEAIRNVEDQNQPGLPYHIIAVQGTQHWGRDLSYYVKHPIASRNGKNVVYETHPYNKSSQYDAIVFTPAHTLPVIIGEFGIVVANPQDSTDTPVTDVDVRTLTTRAEREKIPYLAWSFHQHCPPNLLVDHTLDNPPHNPQYDLCDAGPGFNPMPLDPSPYNLVSESDLPPGRMTFGRLLFDQLHAAH